MSKDVPLSRKNKLNVFKRIGRVGYEEDGKQILIRAKALEESFLFKRTTAYTGWILNDDGFV